VRLTAVLMPITRESQTWNFFGFRSSRCGKSRSRVLVDLALESCSFDDQYVQYSAKRGLQCGLLFRLSRPGLGIQLRGLALDS